MPLMLNWDTWGKEIGPKELMGAVGFVGTWFLRLQALVIFFLQKQFGDPGDFKDQVKLLKGFSSAGKLKMFTWGFLFAELLLKYSHLLVEGGKLPPGVRRAAAGASPSAAVMLIIVHRLSRTINHATKWIVRVPRPTKSFPWLKCDKKKSMEASFSFPSMSVQSVTLVYKLVGERYSVLWMYWPVFTIIATTRVWRGLHYPHDIFMSYTMGSLLIHVVRLLEPWALPIFALFVSLSTAEYLVCTWIKREIMHPPFEVALSKPRAQGHYAVTAFQLEEGEEPITRGWLVRDGAREADVPGRKAIILCVQEPGPRRNDVSRYCGKICGEADVDALFLQCREDVTFGVTEHLALIKVVSKLRQELGYRTVVGLGRRSGAVSVLMAAAESKAQIFDGIVVESPYTTLSSYIQEIVKTKFFWKRIARESSILYFILWGFMSICQMGVRSKVRERFTKSQVHMQGGLASAKAMPPVPILIMHAKWDQWLDERNAKEIHKWALDPKVIWMPALPRDREKQLEDEDADIFSVYPDAWSAKVADVVALASSTTSEQDG